jgi:8-oxo-dGTP pyrophosphatase MutT (NUDIX family)
MNIDERVDLVDYNGMVKIAGVLRTEVKQRKDEFLAQGLYQPIVIVVVVDDTGRIVAQVRGDAKADDGHNEIDHVCGVIASGEDWEQAAAREAGEEIGIGLIDAVVVDQRINDYSRHRTLVVARAAGVPKVVDQHEVREVFSASPIELRELAEKGAPFVRGFFADMELALARVGNGSAAVASGSI